MVVLTPGYTTINLQVGSEVVTVNGEEKTLDTSTQLIEGSTYVPVRFVSEVLGLSVDWDEKTKTVIIHSSEFDKNTISEETNASPYTILIN